MFDDDEVPTPFVFILGMMLAFLMVAIISDVTSDQTNWKAQYQQLVCQTKNLEMGKLEGINVCLDPQSKAVYKIEMPVKAK